MNQSVVVAYFFGPPCISW